MYFLNPKFKPLFIFSVCIARFVSDLLRNHGVGFLMRRLNKYFDKIFESEAIFPLNISHQSGNFGHHLPSLLGQN